MTLWKWSRTASSNASADASINWAEGQPPSSVNDSARAMMAATAKYRDDIAGATLTSGTSTAYTLSTWQLFDSLVHLDGVMVAFTPHTTNGATVTLNVDGTGAKPLRPAPSVELQTGALIQGTPYVAFYNASDAVFYLHGASNYNSYSIPLGGFLPYAGGTAPNSAFVLSYGQAISRTTYATLFSLISTTYGTGDGSTTFNVPDLRGRTICAPDGMGGSSSNRINLVVSNFLGATGGAQQVTLGTGNLTAYTPSGSISAASLSDPQAYFGGVSQTGPTATAYFANSSNASGFSDVGSHNVGSIGSQTFTGNAQGGTSTPFNTVQPTIALNYIMRVI